MTDATDDHADVLIIGGGPAGLTAAADLARRAHGDVLVLDREKQAGGIPRHSDHLGYGISDMQRFICGPAYARRLCPRGRSGWRGHSHLRDGHRLGRRRKRCRSPVPRGAAAVHAKRGRARHRRPRTSPNGPADPRRPPRRGVHDRPAAEPGSPTTMPSPAAGPSSSAASSSAGPPSSPLREAGAGTVLMTSSVPATESYAAFNIAGTLAFRVPVATRTRVIRSPAARESRRSRSRTWTAVTAAPSTATPWSSPATGSRTTSWPGRPA